MDHGYIEQRRVVERYLTDRLSIAERVSFEEHYIACEECLDRLEQAEALVGAQDHAVTGWFRTRLIGVGPAALAELGPAAARPPGFQAAPLVVPVFPLRPASECAVPNGIAARGRFVLCLDFSPDPRAVRFDARVSGPYGVIVSMAKGVPPPASGSLGLTLHSSELRPGRYVVIVDGRTRADESVQTVRFVFHYGSPDSRSDHRASLQ